MHSQETWPSLSSTVPKGQVGREGLFAYGFFRSAEGAWLSNGPQTSHLSVLQTPVPPLSPGGGCWTTGKKWIRSRGTLKGCLRVERVEVDITSHTVNTLQSKFHELSPAKGMLASLTDHRSILKPSTALLFDLEQVSSSLHLNFFICKKRSIILLLLYKDVTHY